MLSVPLLPLEELLTRAASSRSCVAWVTRSATERALPLIQKHGIRLHDGPSTPIPAGLQSLVVIGGGTLIDCAKWAAKGDRRGIRLFAAPSIWGSGAEASRVVVLDNEGIKSIHVDAALLPDARAIWPELARSVPPDRATDACGDTWSHALEGFLSPLASPELRRELVRVMRAMLGLPTSNDPAWFDLSAKACAGQAASSVGLVHGIAHTLEAPLRRTQPNAGWGHARLCATFLHPVLEFNLANSQKPLALAREFSLDLERVRGAVRQVFRAARFAAALPLLEEHWRNVLRDPSTRTNSVLVRPNAIDFFKGGAFA
jgi:alcohol dehydrogenase class IV